MFGISLESAASGGGVRADCHIWDIKETRPNGLVWKAFCMCLGLVTMHWYLFGSVTMHLLRPATACDMEVTPRGATAYDVSALHRDRHSFCSW